MPDFPAQIGTKSRVRVTTEPKELCAALSEIGGIEGKNPTSQVRTDSAHACALAPDDVV